MMEMRAFCVCLYTFQKYIDEDRGEGEGDIDDGWYSSLTCEVSFFCQKLNECRILQKVPRQISTQSWLPHSFDICKFKENVCLIRELHVSYDEFPYIYFMLTNDIF